MIQSHYKGKLVDLWGERGARPEKAHSLATGRTAALVLCTSKAFTNQAFVHMKKPPFPLPTPLTSLPCAVQLWGLQAHWASLTVAQLLQGQWVSPVLCGPTTLVRPGQGQQVLFADCLQVTTTLLPTGRLEPAQWAEPEPLRREACTGERSGPGKHHFRPAPSTGRARTPGSCLRSQSCKDPEGIPSSRCLSSSRGYGGPELCGLECRRNAWP